MNQVVILHGWSDRSKSFQPLADFLKQHGFDTVPLWLGDYISLDDDVRVEDVARRMEQVVRELLGRGELAAPFDLIVHSTGALVAREWISSYYGSHVDKCPAHRLIMLAPANFGSRLAAMGKSMLGRVVKGWNNWFHTGAEMLNALELGSPYQWALAQRDLFVPPGETSAPALYGADGVWPFIIAGSHPYVGMLQQIVNEDGSDGTVRVPAANLNARGMTIDFAADERNPVVTPWRLRQSDPFPFAVLPDRNHSSITDPDHPDIKSDEAARRRLGELILAALHCADRTRYAALVKEWSDVAAQTAALVDSGARQALLGDEAPADYFHQYLQLIVRVVDDHGLEVDDYFLEFCGPHEERGSDSTVYFHQSVLEDVHVNSRNGSRRCLYVDRTDLVDNYYGAVRGAVDKVLNMSISATPPGNNISYFGDYRVGAAGTIALHRRDAATPEARWLRRNTTHLVQIVIPRTPADKVFGLRRY